MHSFHKSLDDEDIKEKESEEGGKDDQESRAVSTEIFLTESMMKFHQASDKLAGYPPLTDNLWKFANQVLNVLRENRSGLSEIGISVVGLVEFTSTVRNDGGYPPFGISFNGGNRSYEALLKIVEIFPLEIRKQLRQLPSGGAEAKDCAASKWELPGLYVGTCEIWVGSTPNPQPLLQGKTGFGSLMYSCFDCRIKHVQRNREITSEKAGAQVGASASNDSGRVRKLFGSALWSMGTSRAIKAENSKSFPHNA